MNLNQLNIIVQLRIALHSQWYYKVWILMLRGYGQTIEFEIFKSHFKWLTLGVFLSFSSHYFSRQGLSLKRDLEFRDWLQWLVSKLLRSSCLCPHFLVLEVQGYVVIPGFYHWVISSESKLTFIEMLNFTIFFIVFPLHCFLFFTLVNNNAINMFSQNVFFPVRLLECPKVIQISKK